MCCGSYVQDYGPGLGMSRDAQLGALPFATILGTVAGGVVDYLRNRGGWVEKFGKAYKGVPCPGTPPSALVLAGVASAPTDLLSTISTKLRAANGGEGPTVAELGNPDTVDLWLHAAMGGSDCRVSNAQARDLPDLVKQLANIGRGFSPSAPSAGGGGGTPVGVTVADYGPGMPANAPSTSQPVPGPSLWDKLKDAAQTVGQTAVQQAGTAVYSSLPGQQRDQLDRYAAGAYSRSLGETLTANAPLLIYAGILVTLVLRRAR